MLRPVKHSRPGLKLVPFRFQSAAGPIVAALYGEGDFTFSAPGTAEGQADLRRPFGQTCLTLATPGPGVGVGGYTYSDTVSAPATNATTGSIQTVTNAGASDTGFVFGYCFGWDTSDPTAFAKDGSEVKTTHPKSRLLWMRIAGGTTFTVGGGDATLVQNSTGNWTINFNVPFANDDLIVMASYQGGNGGSVRVESINARSVNVTIYDNTNTLADDTLLMAVYGTHTASELNVPNGTLMTTQRKTRVIVGRVEFPGGTPTLVLGNDDLTLSVGGTGDITLLYTHPFARDAVALCMGDAVRSFISSPPSASEVRIETTNPTFTNVDTPFNLMVIGSDDPTEYGV